MVKVKIATLLVSLTALFFVGCDTKVIEPPVSNDSLTVKDTVKCDWKGTPITIPVIATNGNWVASLENTADEQWCDFMPAVDSITIVLKENPDKVERKAHIIITSGDIIKTLVVLQERAAEPSLSVTVSQVELAWQGSTELSRIVTNQSSSTAVLASGSSSWCSISKINDELLITATRNNDAQPRSTSITVSAGAATPVTIAVTQVGKSSAVDGVQLSIDLSRNFEASGVYTVWNGDKIIAEVCSEYVEDISSQGASIVVYPCVNGKSDLTKGYVVANGGSLNWNVSNGSHVYVAGSKSPATMVYIKDGVVSATAESGNAKSVVLPLFMQDGQKNNYKVVKIGVQFWMGSNLRTTVFGDGSPISSDVNDAKGGCFKYSDKYTSVNEACGLLYTWKTLNYLAPTGWHAPTISEWNSLSQYVGVDKDALYLRSQTGWDMGAVVAGNNYTGFSALPGGSRLEGGKCTRGGEIGCWWSNSDGKTNPETHVVYGASVEISGNQQSETKLEANKLWSNSVRLIRD